MAKKKTKVIKAKVKRVNRAQRMSKGAETPWMIFSVSLLGYHEFRYATSAEKDALRWIKKWGKDWRCLVIVHIDIPPMAY